MFRKRFNADRRPKSLAIGLCMFIAASILMPTAIASDISDSEREGGFLSFIEQIGDRIAGLFSSDKISPNEEADTNEEAGPSFIQRIGKAIGNAIGDVGEGISKAFSATGDALAAAAGGAGKAFSQLGSIIGEVFERFGVWLWSLKPQAMSDGAYAGVVAGASTATVAAAGFGAYYLYWLKKLSPLGMPLFSRISKESMLNNPVRNAVYHAIIQNPGINTSELSRKLGIGWGTTVHHLDKLSSEQMISTRDVKNQKCYFENGGIFSRGEMTALSALKNETALTIFHYIITNPERTQKDIADALGLSPALVSWHVKKLFDEDVVQRVRRGKSLHLIANERVAGRLLDFNSSMLPNPAGSFSS
ncbi:MAG: hypothetical protein CVT48_06765 [Thermoplasmata archaeon HGW-Thermoplasmata-1]|nr:MAG: hypothetical protein CVT48_06765 [Thermoplasmata archaeon HGW-Thermoplasmata-1]